MVLCWGMANITAAAASGMETTARGAARFLVRRDARHRAAALGLHAKAASQAQGIVNHIIRNYRPSGIYQWGSVLDPGLFSEMSDIDIAVEGILAAEDYFRLLGEAAAMTDFPLDLVQMEKIDPVFAEQIRATGKRIYPHDPVA